MQTQINRKNIIIERKREEREIAKRDEKEETLETGGSTRGTARQRVVR